MITGIHAIFYTKHSKEMYDFLKGVLDLHYVDAGNGRLFFTAPPTELAVHETEDDPGHELWLILRRHHRDGTAAREEGNQNDTGRRPRLGFGDDARTPQRRQARPLRTKASVSAHVARNLRLPV